MIKLPNGEVIYEWDDLTRDQQTTYLNKAQYLIDNKYILNTDVEAIAQKMHKNEQFGGR